MNQISEPLSITSDRLAAGAGDDPGEFPIACLPPAMRAMVWETAKQTMTPNSMSAVVALATTAAAIGRSIMVNSGGSRRTTANLYIHVIAASGEGKGSSYNYVVKPLYEAESKAIEQWKSVKLPKIMTSIEVVKQQEKQIVSMVNGQLDQEAKNQLVDSMGALKKERQILEEQLYSCPCYVVGDITREALALKLSGQPSEALACFSSEARGIYGVILGRYSKGGFSDEDIYLSSYSGDPINVNRISRPPISLKHPCLTALLMTQEDAARALFEDERMTVSGLMPRSLMVHVRMEPRYEPEVWPEINSNVVQFWANLVNEILEYRASRSEPLVIQATDEARAILRVFRNQTVGRIRIGGDLCDIKAYAARWGENAWRMALVLHVAIHRGSAGSVMMEEATAKAALCIMEWFVAHPHCAI